MENAFIESFNGRFRDECLSQTWFTDLDDAQPAMEVWARDCNESRPHTSLGGPASREYVAQLLAEEALEEAIWTENLSQPSVQRRGRPQPEDSHSNGNKIRGSRQDPNCTRPCTDRGKPSHQLGGGDSTSD